MLIWSNLIIAPIGRWKSLSALCTSKTRSLLSEYLISRISGSMQAIFFLSTSYWRGSQIQWEQAPESDPVSSSQFFRLLPLQNQEFSQRSGLFFIATSVSSASLRGGAWVTGWWAGACLSMTDSTPAGNSLSPSHFYQKLQMTAGEEEVFRQGLCSQSTKSKYPKTWVRKWREKSPENTLPLIKSLRKVLSSDC